MLDEPAARGSHPARDVLDLGMAVGTAALTCGASVATTVRLVRRVMRPFSLAEIQVDVTSNMLNVYVRAARDQDPLIAMRVVPVGVQDFGRIGRLDALVRTVDTRSAPHDVIVEIDRLMVPTPAWMGYATSAALGGVAGAAALMLGSSVVIGVLAVVVASSIHRLQVALNKRGAPAFFQQFAGGAAAAGVTLGVAALERHHVRPFVGLSPGLIVTGAIIAMLAGLAILGAAEDAVTGYYVTGSARAFEGIIVTIGLVGGVSAVIGAASRLDLRVNLAAHDAPHALTVATVIWAAAVSLFYALCSRTGVRVAAGAAVVGAIGWSVAIGLSASGIGQIPITGIAAIAVGVLSFPLARLQGVPLNAVTTSGVVPLLPGLLTYRGVSQIVGGQSGDLLAGEQTLVTAAGVALALAAGTAIGAGFARTFTATARRAGSRARGWRRLAG